MNRRRFLASLGAAGLPAWGWAAADRAARARANRVVVAGGGIGGTAFVLTLRRLAPEAEISVIEPQERFLFAPATLEYVFGRASWDDVTRDYAILARHGIRHLRAEVTGIDPKAQAVRTSAGVLEYGRLVIATGIRPATEDVAGLAPASDANASLYDRASLRALREQVAAFAGGTALVAIPPPPHSCPPAAYEFALLLADHLRARRIKGRVLVLDASTQPQPAPLSGAFDAAIRRAGALIEYVPSIRVARLEAGAGRVVSADGESFSYALLCLIAPHKAARFIAEAGLTEGADPFVQVDPASFRAVRDEAIYAFGDAARTPYARAADSAAEAARICAHAVARELKGAGREQPAAFRFEAPCYPHVSAEEALSLRIAYRVEGDADVDIKVAAETSPARAHLASRRAWQQRFPRELFGA